MRIYYKYVKYDLGGSEKAGLYLQMQISGAKF